MKRLPLIIAIILILAGCVTPPVPENYSGPLASIDDSAQSETANRAQFFFLSEIDGNPVRNILMATRSANSGRGFSLNAVPFSRDIPAKKSTLTLQGAISYGAPIQAILNSGTLYAAEKRITFAPDPNKRYVVKGVLTADKREVWLEERATGKRIE